MNDLKCWWILLVPRKWITSLAAQQEGMFTKTFYLQFIVYEIWNLLLTIWKSLHVAKPALSKWHCGKSLLFVDNEIFCKFRLLVYIALYLMLKTFAFCQNQNTHFLFSNFFLKIVCYIWDNVKKYCRARQATVDGIIWGMCFPCWVTKATDTHSEYVIFIALPWHHWLLEHASLLGLDIHCFCCLTIVWHEKWKIWCQMIVLELYSGIVAIGHSIRL